MNKKTLIAKIFQIICYWPFYLGFKFHVHFRVEGQENLKGLEDRAVIFASNHYGYLDPPMSAATMPRDFLGLFPSKFFPVRFLAYKEFFQWKNRFPFPISLFIAAYTRINGSVSVASAKGNLPLALHDTVEALKNGDKIWIYPEGKMNVEFKNKVLRPGKRGVAYLHRETGVPIVPAGITGSHGLSLKNFLLRRNRVKIKIGKPIYSFPENDSLENIAEKVMVAIERLVG